MTKKMDEAEFIEMFTASSYYILVKKSFEAMQQTEEFKNDHPVCTSIMITNATQENGTRWTIAVEMNAKKLIGNVVDFGIAQLWVSDEELPDEVLDRINEYKRHGA